MAGDSEWRIGEPMTAASRVAPVITAARPPDLTRTPDPVCWHSSLSRRNSS